MTTSTIRPVLVGADQVTDRQDDLKRTQSPLDMMQTTAQGCAIDAGLSTAQLTQIDTLAMVNSVGPQLVDNPPAALAKRLGMHHARQFLTVTGGNTPQMLVNHYAQKIAQGRSSMVLLTGAEALHSLSRFAKADTVVPWSDENSQTQPTLFSPEKPGTNKTEHAHGMSAPIVTYPLFENALRHHYRRTYAEHQGALGKLFAPFTTVAKNNPHAWFPTERSATEISEPTKQNRYIGLPYTKYLNSIMQVNQSASLLLTSDKKARELGIDESKWVYLHGCADVNDIWNVSERINFYDSPALRLGTAAAMAMAGIELDRINHFDLYSCFPAVVQMACDAMGLSTDDSRGLTVTGGLPYFGGAGNNYSMHAIATMMERLQQNPGDFGMVTANGWYVTKHALGIYSNTRPTSPFSYADPSELNRQIDALKHPMMEESPDGSATVETYTVMFDRDGQPARGLILGSLARGKRFVAYTRDDRDTLDQIVSQDPIGRSGRVSCGSKTNLFEFS